MQRLHLPIFSRPVETTPYNRIPSDRFLVPGFAAELIGAPSIVLFGSIFMSGWNFHFPSAAERRLWRVASTYTLSYTLVGGLYAQYCEKILFPGWSASQQDGSLPKTERQGRSHELMERLRNIHPAQNPQLGIPLRALIPVSFLCALYCLARGYILVEDVIGLRSMPPSAFQTVEWSVYVPHW